MATRDDLGLECNSVGQRLLVSESANLEYKALGYILVHDLEMQRPWRIQMGYDTDMRYWRCGWCC